MDRLTVLSLLCFSCACRCQSIDSAVELIEESSVNFPLNHKIVINEQFDNSRDKQYSELQFLESSGDSNVKRQQQPENLTHYAEFIRPNPSAASHLTYEYCYDKYSERAFLPFDKQATNRPTMLYTFPGVGNHWVQLLIEYATGIYTGSAYKERLTMLLPGATHCDASVSMIKIHMHHFHFSDIHKGNFTSKCVKGGISHFERAVLLIRNPFDAIWSEYQRRVTSSSSSSNFASAIADSKRNNYKSGASYYGHVGMIQQQDFDEQDWYKVAMELSGKYVNMHNVHYESLLKTYDVEKDVLFIQYENFLQVQQQQQQQQQQRNHYDDKVSTSSSSSHPNQQRQKQHKSNIHQSNLNSSNRNTHSHIQELQKLAQFLHLPTTEARLACAFLFADSPKAHRKSKTVAENSSSSTIIATNNTIVTKAQAYGSGNNKNLVCDMWKLFGVYAQKYSYSIWNDTDCTTDI